MKHNYFLLMILFLTFNSHLFPQTNSWQKASHNDGGTSVSLAMDSKGNIYNLTESGLFRSTDQGNSWEKIETGTGTYVKDLYISPNDSLFISEYIYDYKANFFGYQIKYSTDYGNNWNKLTVSSNSGTYNPQTVVFNSQGTLFSGTNNGLFYSKDNGKSWTSEPLFSNRSIIKIAYVNKTLVAFSYIGIQREYVSVSKDEGKTWQDTSWSNPGFTFTNCSIAAGSGNKLFVVVKMSAISYSSSIFLSTDGGNTWKMNGSKYVLNSASSDSYGNLWGATDSKEIVKSTDDGVNWTVMNKTLTNSFIQSLLLDSKNNIYAGTIDGVLFSNDNGNTWKELTNGLNINNLQYLVSDKKGNLYALATGVLRSTDHGESWHPFNNGFSSSSIQEIFSVNGALFAFEKYVYNRYNQRRAGYKLVDSLDKWQVISVFMSDMAGSSNGTIYALYCEPYLDEYAMRTSNDSGYTWTDFANSITKSLHSSTIAADSKGLVYISGGTSGIYKSADNGVNWTKLNYYESTVSKIIVSSNDHVFVKADDYRILRSKDEGITWEPVNNNLPDEKIVSVYTDEAKNLYIVMGDGHLYYSYNDGDNWNDITYNLASQSIISVVRDNNSRLYITTQSNEIYYLDARLLSIEEIKPSLEYELFQNYPNPFNPKTSIRFSIASPGNVKLKLYDILGNQVEILIDEYKDKGKYNFELDASKLSNGIYFYRLETGSYSDTKKMVLIK